MTLGECIRVAREALDISPQEAAQRCGTNPSTYYDIEGDRTDPRWSTLRPIVVGLGMSLDALTGDGQRRARAKR